MRFHWTCVGSRCVSRVRLLGVLLLLVGLSWLAWAQFRGQTPSRTTAEEFFFHHDHIIGTSLDLCVVAPNENAAIACEQAILKEIERLRLVFSTFDPASEISRLNRSSSPFPASPEMLEVLRLYESMQERSNGAFNGQLGELVSTWKAAEKAGTEPDPAVLEEIVLHINQPGWKIDDLHHTVMRLTSQPLDLNSIAKGFIIQRAALAARRAAPSMQGLLLNLGGDLYVWGQDASAGQKWLIGVQDPFNSADNAPLLTTMELQDKAIATSGGYERFYTFNGKRLSHIFDPRTGRPAKGVASATVVASNNVTANALATTLCVLTPEECLRLVAETPGAECLIVTDGGQQLRSAGMMALEVAQQPPPPEAPKTDPPPPNSWPAEMQVSITVTLPTIQSARAYRRPYVAVWVEGADGKAVRTLAVWGNSSKYLKDLTNWWAISKNDNNLVKAVTRATRAPGKYTLVWDGKDSKGTALPQGAYTVRIEVSREHGNHVLQTGKIECRTDPATITMQKNAETEASIVEYGKKK